MNTLGQHELAELRRYLIRERDETVRRLKDNRTFGMDDPMKMELGELSVIDNHPADIGTELFERGKDLALTEMLEHQLAKAEAALERMNNGTYGTCLTCGQPIPLERLKALPSAEYCIQHVPDNDTSFRRPREEQILQPAMHSDTDDYDTAAFDGEDAWQIVERWGTSNTPALQEGNENVDYNDLYIEASEQEGYVEPLESFLVTDMYGNNTTFVRNSEYERYWEQGEGSALLEPDPEPNRFESDG